MSIDGNDVKRTSVLLVGLFKSSGATEVKSTQMHVLNVNGRQCSEEMSFCVRVN